MIPSSFPVRERGLKPVELYSSIASDPSFPVRERGLKHVLLQVDDPINNVVPRAGTWIETTVSELCGEPDDVVPRAGTWIETPCWSCRNPTIESFPVRERGLKPSLLCLSFFFSLSFPVRERGLKPCQTPHPTKSQSRSPCGNVD